MLDKVFKPFFCLLFKVDLKCSVSATGPTYYRECLPKVGEIKRQPNANRLQVGDRVSVCLDADVLKAMSAGHGGWIDEMARVREKNHKKFGFID